MSEDKRDISEADYLLRYDSEDGRDDITHDITDSPAETLGINEEVYGNELKRVVADDSDVYEQQDDPL